MKTFTVYYDTLTPVVSKDYPSLNSGYDCTPYQTEVQAETLEDAYLQFPDNSEISNLTITEKY